MSIPSLPSISTKKKATSNQPKSYLVQDRHSIANFPMKKYGNSWFKIIARLILLEEYLATKRWISKVS